MVFVLEERGLETIWGNISSQPLANEKAKWVIYMPPPLALLRSPHTRPKKFISRPLETLRQESCRFPSSTFGEGKSLSQQPHMDRKKLFARANHSYQPSA